MIRFTSAEMTLLQAQDARIDDLPLDNRSDEWWDKFWTLFGQHEAKRVKERV